MPGVLVIAAGLLLNLAVVALNGGMPVMAGAAAAAGLHGQLSVPAGDFVHVVGLPGTRLPWLADVITLPGPTPMRLVASPGDLLLYEGVATFLAGARPEADCGCATSR